MITRYVNTASSAGGDGTTNNTAGATRAFATLAEALDSLPGTLADAYTINCSGTAADTVTCNQAHWDFVTSSTNYLEIRGNNTTGKYNTNAYRIEVTNQHGIYNSAAAHVRLYDIQVQITVSTSTGNNFDGMRLATANNDTTGTVDHRYYRCIFKCVISGGATDNAYGFNDSDPTTSSGGTASGGTAKRVNCLAYGGYAGFETDSTSWAASNVTNYNCTSYGNEFNFLDSQVCKNCLATANRTGDGFDFLSTGSTGHTNNASGDSSAVGTSARTNQSANFKFVDAANGDFHLLSNDTGALNFGATDPGSGLYSDDIDGVARSGSWDIGADEYVASGTVTCDMWGNRSAEILIRRMKGMVPSGTITIKN